MEKGDKELRRCYVNRGEYEKQWEINLKRTKFKAKMTKLKLKDKTIILTQVIRTHNNNCFYYSSVNKVEIFITEIKEQITHKCIHSSRENICC